MITKLMNKDNFYGNEKIRAFFHSKRGEGRIHSHEFWELAYIYEGSGRNRTSEGFYKIKEGDFIFIKPGAEHSIVSSDNAFIRICNCIFTQEYFDSLKEEYKAVSGIQNYTLYSMLFDNDSFCIHLSDDNAKNVRHLMWLIAHEYNHFTEGSETVIRHSMLDLLVIITRLYDYSIKKFAPTVSKSAEIDELMKYMRSNFGYKLTLELLADQVHLSREYLSRYFKQYTGKTISEFLTEIRISKAKEMLRTSSYPIADIGTYCGYPSISNFQKAFKKASGMPPSEYRKKFKDF